jgi:hypothetical protein
LVAVSFDGDRGKRNALKLAIRKRRRLHPIQAAFLAGCVGVMGFHLIKVYCEKDGGLIFRGKPQFCPPPFGLSSFR